MLYIACTLFFIDKKVSFSNETVILQQKDITPITLSCKIETDSDSYWKLLQS